MIDPSDRRTHIERINDAKEDGMTEAQFQAFLAHQTEQIDRLIAATAELLAPVVAAAEMQVAYMEREIAERAAYEEREAQRAADAAAAEQAARDAEKSDKKGTDKA